MCAMSLLAFRPARGKLVFLNEKSSAVKLLFKKTRDAPAVVGLRQAPSDTPTRVVYLTATPGESADANSPPGESYSRKTQ